MTFDLTSIFNFILSQFEQVASWLFNTYIRIGNFSISWGMLAIMLLVIHILFNFLLPWFTDNDDSEGGENT